MIMIVSVFASVDNYIAESDALSQSQFACVRACVRVCVHACVRVNAHTGTGTGEHQHKQNLICTY